VTWGALFTRPELAEAAASALPPAARCVLLYGAAAVGAWQILLATS